MTVCIALSVVLCLFSMSALALEDEWATADQLSFNLMKEDNIKVHNTKLFRSRSGLYVRHGLDAHLAVKLDKHCDKPFKFQLIENGNTTIFTWTQKPQIKSYNEHHFYLHISKNILVGQYTLNISNFCSGDANKNFYLCDVNVLFNPWLTQSDTSGNERVRRQVFDSTNTSNNEYLNNNNGYIWLWNVAIPWSYAVGSQVIVDSKNRLTQLMSQAERLNQVEYSRALSRYIGSNVLYGRWDGYYSDGVEPTQWVGSEEIFQRWLQTGQRVRYAQCWVFAGILTTMLRASGIPARTVTNYISHHDRGLTSDYRAVLRQYDNIIQSDESTWNFHVWSEAWLERPDLGEPADWNAVDATPQEPSPLAPGQPYRAGPAYVPYIQANRRTANYDTYFILAEVNARGICPITGRLLPTRVGSLVVTKSIGNTPNVYNFFNPDYITQNYKIPLLSKRAADDITPELPPPFTSCERDGGMRVSISPSTPMVGEDFMITVTEGNVSVEDVVIRMELRNYMGESLGIVRNFTGIRVLNVREADYLPYLGSTSILRFTVGVYNDSGHFVFHHSLQFRFQYEPLEVEASRPDGSSTITLTVTYTNPLSIPMVGVMLSVSTPNNTYMMLEQPDIPAGDRFTMTLDVECGDNDETDVMIPISLDSNVTQSAYGAGWSSCSQGAPGSAVVTVSLIPILQLVIVSLFALLLVYPSL